MLLDRRMPFKFLPVLYLIMTLQCEKEDIIVPGSGYNWPSQDRVYWPTQGWQNGLMEDHGVNPSKMELANKFAAEDSLTRALLVIKDGYIVFEKYYGEGGVNKSTKVPVTHIFLHHLFIIRPKNFPGSLLKGISLILWGLILTH
jgi:hypothetical protein